MKLVQVQRAVLFVPILETRTVTLFLFFVFYVFYFFRSCKVEAEAADKQMEDEFARIMAQAIRPWSPITHGLWPRHFREMVFFIFCVSRRLQQLPLRAALPNELWCEILSFCARDDWPSTSTEESL